MAGKARPSKVKPAPLPPVEAGPAAPVVRIDVQVVTRRPAYRCTKCGSARVRPNGMHPPVCYFVCLSCTDDEGNETTFKLPVAP